jgi:hypothetical protein
MSRGCAPEGTALKWPVFYLSAQERWSALIIQTHMPSVLMGYPLFGMLGLGLVIAILRSGGF